MGHNSDETRINTDVRTWSELYWFGLLRNNFGGKNNGLYRSIARSIISQSCKFEYKMKKFGSIKSKSELAFICWGCGHGAFGAAGWPFDELSKQEILSNMKLIFVVLLVMDILLRYNR